MLRRSVIFLPILVVGCGKASKTPTDMLPPEPEGWKRGDVTVPAREIPSAAESLGVVASAEALYLGEGRVRVRVFQMKAETVAFELMQKWRNTDGLGAYKGPYFFVAKGEDGAKPEDVMELLGLIQKAAAAS